MIANELCFDAEINDEDMEKLIDSSRHRSKLKLLREGSSRRVYKLNDEVLLTEFKDQVHSNKDGFIVVNGTSIERVRIYKILNDYLTKNGVPGSAIAFYDRCVAHRNLPVSENIEVIVKTRIIGSTKHQYVGLGDVQTRFGGYLKANTNHRPFIRFDWRSVSGDRILPNPLADYFIDTDEASKTVYRAFRLLCDRFSVCDLDLIDACFYLTSCGRYLCVEVSPDNLGNIEYVGNDAQLTRTINHKDKGSYLTKYKMIRTLLEATI
ncbi:MAG: hypothetical protein CMK83_10320 [Pseudomonadales bacterium]|nr:hypothetical protein [Pseudomonadales bacterium]MEC8814021.1 hypothetical protein [Pseudomonadota bacterium]HCE77059.1 hypothetical protein [Dehalococcoidia bacterium]|tara:strand:- start:1921 stop:2715 length:795 start_codon:yes stop_codon:yes gene_type:complete